MIAGIVVAVLTVSFLVYFVYSKASTVPLPSYKSGFQDVKDGSGAKVKEGFYGGVARGSGIPDCLRESSEGAELIGMFMGRKEGDRYVESDGDLRELTHIVSILSCFKKDLVSPSHIVEATRYQNYVTSSDIEAIGVTTGRCFSKTISNRDFELMFDKWTSRGSFLLKRLCTEYSLTEAERVKAEQLFQYVIRDVKDIGRAMCFVGEPTIVGKPTPREPAPFEDPSLTDLGPYTGYY